MKAVDVTRDTLGMWMHPELPKWGEDTRPEQAEEWFNARGLTHHLVIMDGDLGERWCKGELESCAEWEPETTVENSFVVGIWDTDDGVVAMFASPMVLEIEVPKQVMIDAWVAEYARLLITQCHFDLATAISMGQSAIKNFGNDVEESSPMEAVEEEISAMRLSC